MRIVSLIPSWTETLIEAGVDVVGRTRFCVRPESAVAKIPIVGGTKDANWAAIQKLKPDYVIMDKEENTAEMAANCPFPLIVTHVTSLESLRNELFKVSQKLQASILMQMKIRLDKILAQSVGPWDWSQMPGVIQPLSRPMPAKKLYYIIWNRPWMCIGPDTFIYSMFKFLNAPIESWDQKKYSKRDELVKSPEIFYLFSTEPYPFAEKISEIRGFQGAIVDGENYSWFGYRSIIFLEKTLGITPK